MMIEDKDLESIIWLKPPVYDSGWRVMVSGVPVFNTRYVEKAEEIANKFKDAIVRSVKEQIMELVGATCARCIDERPKLVKTVNGSRCYHKDRFLGWQPCDAEFIWLMMIRDAKERRQAHGSLERRV